MLSPLSLKNFGLSTAVNELVFQACLPELLYLISTFRSVFQLDNVQLALFFRRTDACSLVVEGQALLVGRKVLIEIIL